jgi:hypothetical protein
MGLFRNRGSGNQMPPATIEEIEAMTIEAPEPTVEAAARGYLIYRKLGGQALPGYAEELLQKAFAAE